MNEKKEEWLKKQEEVKFEREKREALFKIAASFVLMKNYDMLEEYNELYFEYLASKKIINKNYDRIKELEQNIRKISRDEKTFNIFNDIIKQSAKCFIDNSVTPIFKIDKNSSFDFLKVLHFRHEHEEQFNFIENNFNGITKEKFVPYYVIAAYVFLRRFTERNTYFSRSPISIYRQQFTQLYNKR